MPLISSAAGGASRELGTPSGLLGVRAPPRRDGRGGAEEDLAPPDRVAFAGRASGSADGLRTGGSAVLAAVVFGVGTTADDTGAGRAEAVGGADTGDVVAAGSAAAAAAAAAFRTAVRSVIRATTTTTKATMAAVAMNPKMLVQGLRGGGGCEGVS